MLMVAQPISMAQAGGVVSDIKGALSKGKEAVSDVAATAQNVRQLTHDADVLIKVIGVGVVGALAIGAVAVLRRKR